MVYGHLGPRTLRTQDIAALVPKCPCRRTLRHQQKNLRHFVTGAEVSTRHFGTSAEMSGTLWHH